MGDFRRIIQSQLEELRDAVVKQHVAELEILRQEARDLRQELSSMKQKVRRDNERRHTSTGGGAPEPCPEVLDERIPTSPRQTPRRFRSEGARSNVTDESTGKSGVKQRIDHADGALSQQTQQTQQPQQPQQQLSLVPPPPEQQQRHESYDTALSLTPVGRGMCGEKSNWVACKNTIGGMKQRSRYTVRDYWVSKFELLQRQSTMFALDKCISDDLEMKKARTTSASNASPASDRFVLDPHSPLSMTWGCLSFILVMYDLATIPIDLAFSLPSSTWHLTLAWISRLFWTLDVAVTCNTGVFIDGIKEMKLARIRFWYAKTWLPLDAVIVGSDWLMIIISYVVGARQSPLALLRVFRFLRLLRLVRVGKLKRLVTALNDRLLSDMPGFLSTVGDGLKIMCFFALGVHMLACMGYSISENWVQPDYGPDNAMRNYLSAVYWILTQLHGAEHILASSTSERGFACTLVFCSFLLYAFIVARATYAIFLLKKTKAAKMLAVSRRFAKCRRISVPLTTRLQHYLKAQHDDGVAEDMANEKQLLACLPETLQMDLNAEMRVPVTLSAQFFRDLLTYNPRALRRLSHVAMADMVYLVGETVFAYGDGCRSMLFVTRGSLSYVPTKFRQSVGMTSSLHLNLNCHIEASADQQQTKPGTHLCEQTLWTTWEHKGHLTADEDSVLLALVAEKFESVVRQHATVMIHAVKYARHFVWHLNHGNGKSSPGSDIVNICLPIERLDEELFHGSEEDHFIFISHSKKEAGTEATLLHEDLERMIREDKGNIASELKTPVFLDSENLADLEALSYHVRKSRYLLLLLTPTVLLRPWCLVELVHAVREGVGVILVDVQRPGETFQFPTEDFYRRMRAGELLDQDAVELLRNEQIELENLVDCLRTAFKKISLPFSPHKSCTIRNAELAAILKTCEPIEWEPSPWSYGQDPSEDV